MLRTVEVAALVRRCFAAARKRKGSNTGTGNSSRPTPTTGDAEFVQAKLREKKEDSTCSSPNANSVNPQVPPYIGKLRPG